MSVPYDLVEIIAEKIASILTAGARKRISSKNFANLPATKKKVGDTTKAKATSGSYPIHDKRHAYSALAFVTRHGSPAEKKRVRNAVKNKWPNLYAQYQINKQKT